MSNIALITGASAGIGAAFAHTHAATGGDVILVARRADALNALKAELESTHNITAHVFAADIGTASAARDLWSKIMAAGLRVEILINNAGFGGHGKFHERDLDTELAMIDLNVDALVTLTHLAANEMVKNGGGKILQVGSTAGMMPGPLQAIYFATKAFVVSFAQAIDHELRPHGVTCSVLAPGYVETEFAKVANLGGTNLVKNGRTAKDTADIGYAGMQKGKLVIYNETMLGLVVGWIIPLMPRRMVLKFVENMQTKNQ